ncbi:MAG: purine-nucleoside phosphorylase [Thermodesulfobacteriota bacterium]|nr:purine-nucleoside phosphorylase [Thermodesulfobacteriota bacterium]
MKTAGYDVMDEKVCARRLSAITSAASADTALILGTGLGCMEKDLVIEDAIPYAEIPGFPRSSVAGHSGRLIFGRMGDKNLVVMSGRFHLYEGYSPAEITFPIRVFSLMGIQRLFISNAAGGLRRDMKAGGIMLIQDHINLTALNPLTGPNLDDMGPRFPDMTAPYPPGLRSKALEHAETQGIDLKQGVYVQVPGPSMETAAETRMLRILGADAVGMSTVMEVIAAVHCGMQVLGISAITNINDPDNPRPAPIEEVIEMAGKAGPLIAEIFRGCL